MGRGIGLLPLALGIRMSALSIGNGITAFS